LCYADDWGLAKVHKKLVELEAQYGVHFKPAALLEEMVEKNETFYKT